ncbi:DivIVA domain-containing protein [Nocardioides plantarum]|uniref:DivIVA domain-containing protein n=1 Tax=Nocardioides plantarum TaxID=29299 RepID=A0ABV5KBV2_9ACTN|nr:DivIVA domain-containing protein [Nocardioides plantarum]
MDDLPALVRDVRFMPRLGGYAMTPVDQALDRLVEALEAGADGEAVSALCDPTAFATARLRMGYDRQEVDDFLRDLARTAGGPERPADWPVYEAPDVVSEQLGWRARLRGRRR